MRQYLDLLQELLLCEEENNDRTGVGTLKTNGKLLSFDVRDGFPILTTKKIHLPSVIHELLWIISGDTNIRYLNNNKVRIWNEWADEDGDLGPIYGKQWRSWEDNNGKIHDQLLGAIHLIKKDPGSRRIIISAWNVGELDKMALTPCHCLFQFFVSGDRKFLDLVLYQRSADYFLGAPFNITSYALFLMMVSQVCNLTPRKFTHMFGDVHLYQNHIEQAHTQLIRPPMPLPQMLINPDVKEITKFHFDDFVLRNYLYHKHISAPIAV